MRNNFVPIPSNTTLLIGLDFWNKTFWDMYNNLIFFFKFSKSYIIVNLWYQNLKFHKTYLPKGYLVLVIPGVVSIDQVHYQNPQLYPLSTGIMVWIPWKWKLRRLLKDRKMRFSHSHHNLLRFLVRCLSPHYWTLSRIASKKMF